MTNMNARGATNHRRTKTLPETPPSHLENVRTSSNPSDLKITDMRIAVVGHGSWRWPIIRLYTNQGLVGLG